MPDCLNKSIVRGLCKTVYKFILKEKLLPANGRLLLAVSGGVDSVVMLDIYRKLAESLGLFLCVAHLNHCLRGTDSLRDEAFVRDLARALGLPVLTERQNVAGYAREHRLGVEEAARLRRYDFLHATARKFDCDGIALAHHMQDNAESILLNIARGTGLTGLAGIRPRRADGVVRPLLCLDRQEIEAYAEAAGLAFVTDHTNISLDFQRNRVRHGLLAEMRAHFNPQIVQALHRLGELSHAENIWADDLADAWLRKNSRTLVDGLVFELAVFNTLPQALAMRVLRRALQRVKGDLRRIEMQHIDKIAKLALNREPLRRLDLPDRILVVKYGEALEFRKMLRPLREVALAEAPADYCYTVTDGLEIEIRELCLRLKCTQVEQDARNIIVNALQNCVFFAIKNMVLPLYIRNCRRGDVFSPQGLSGHVKLKKFYNAVKLPAHQRLSWPVVVDANDEILWAVGLRLAEKARINNSDKAFLKIEVLPY